jgi:hypothetical protein
VRRPCLFILAALTPAALIAGCGGSGSSNQPPPQPEPTAKPADFPAVTGKSLNDLASMADGQGPVLAASVSIVHKGRNRFGFALFDTAKKQITGAQVALYTGRRDGSNLRGPYVARSESLAVKPQFQSQTTASDPDAAKSVYVADLPFTRTGQQGVIAMAKLDGRLLISNGAPVDVTRRGSGPPDVGQRAVDVHTQTLTDVGGDATRIDTRRPVAKDLLQVDLADALGKQPVVLTFATPLLCQSRVCGPVVDVADQVRSEFGARVAFIHQEIYKDNQVDKGLRPQLLRWRLASEPWIFVVNRSGRITARFEGAVSVPELRAAVQKAV